MKKSPQSLFDQMMKDKNFKKKFEERKQLFELEYQLAQIMEAQGVTQKELAKRLKVDKSVISKDMSGALKRAGMKKLQAIAEALDCDFVPLFVPRKKKTS